MKKLGVIFGFILGLGMASAVMGQTATQLPNAMTQFTDQNGVPYAAGKVFFYVPGTTTPKTTWVDVNQATANANPVTLDSAGRALIYGAGEYREVLWDQFGNTIWDQLTWATNPSLGQSFTPGVLAGNPGPGTGPLAAITVGAGLQLVGSTLSTQSSYPATVSDVVNQTVALAFNGTQRYATGALTYTLPAGATLPNGFSFWIYALTGNVTITPNSIDAIGQLATAASLVIPTGASIRLTGNGGTSWQYELTYGNAAVVAPCGRLTLTSGVPVLSTTVTAATSVLFTPTGGCSTVPVWNGTQFMNVPFTETTQLLTDTTLSPAAAVAGGVYDYFEWLDSAGAIVVTRGPAWGSSTSRGYTLTNVGGLLVNTAAVTNGPDVKAGVYVGTIVCDAAVATVSFNPTPAAASGGPTNGAWVGLWNYYNRVPVAMAAQDSKASWNGPGSSVWRASDNSSNNRVTYVVGLTEDVVAASFVDYVTGVSTTVGISAFGIGVDSTSVQSGDAGMAGTDAQNGASSGNRGSYSGIPGLGQHYLQAIEQTNTTNTMIYGLYASGLQAHGLSAQLRY